MANETYDLVFNGELVRGADEKQARINIGNLFKVSGDKVDALFSGKPIVLKRGLNFDTASKYRLAIKKAGCRVDVIEKKHAPEVQGKAVFGHSEPDVSPSVASSTPSTPSDDRQTLPLAHVAEVHEPVKASDFSAAENKTVELGLAPVGGDILKPDEKEVNVTVNINIDSLSLKEQEGDLLGEDEKTPFVPLDVEVNASLAPVGDVILSASEREDVVPVQVDVSGLSIAEVGVELGQEKDEKEEVHPDISHLHLASLNE